MTTGTPWKTMSLFSIAWVWRQVWGHYEVLFPTHYSSKANTFWCYTSGGAQKVSWRDQTAQLPLLPVRWWSWQTHCGEDWPLSLQDWLRGAAGCSCSNQHQAVPTQPPEEVCRGSSGTGRGAVHVVWAAQLWPLGDPASAGSYQLPRIYQTLRYCYTSDPSMDIL